MKSFKFFWTTHKWAGIILSAVFACMAVTGFLLLIKKQSDWIQPPTLAGAPGEPADFVSIGAALDAVYATGHDAFRSFDDIDRIDVRPDKRVYKVHSHHDHMEAQVDAITGTVLGIETRRSDLIENIHDGSFFADWIHKWIMPAVAVTLLFMVFSGLWLWLEPKLRRRRRRKRAAQRRAAANRTT